MQGGHFGLKNNMQIWYDEVDTVMAVQSGSKSVLMPATHVYFDFPESKPPGEVKGATCMPPIPIERVYYLHVNDYSAGELTTIGVEACFWSDQFIHE